MAVDTRTVVPRSLVSLGVEPRLRASLALLARDRVLVLDYFASRRCAVVIGDLTIDFEQLPPGPGYVEFASIEGVRVFVEARLVPVLRDNSCTVVLRGPTFARHLSVRFDRPECWIDFLDGPGVLSGKRPAWPRPRRAPHRP